MVAECESPTLQVPKSTTGYDPESVASPSCPSENSRWQNWGPEGCNSNDCHILRCDAMCSVGSSRQYGVTYQKSVFFISIVLKPRRNGQWVLSCGIYVRVVRWKSTDISCLAYSSAMKIEATFSSERSRNIGEVLSVISQKTELFKTTVVFTSYCDGPLLHNERLLTDAISTVTDTENYPITRNSQAKYCYRDNRYAPICVSAVTNPE
jgi:hypothetical protein